MTIMMPDSYEEIEYIDLELVDGGDAAMFDLFNDIAGIVLGGASMIASFYSPVTGGVLMGIGLFEQVGAGFVSSTLHADEARNAQLVKTPTPGF